MIHHGRAEAGPYLKNLLCEKGQSGNARYAACGYYVQVYRSSSPGFTIEQQRSSIYDTAALLLCLYDTLQLNRMTQASLSITRQRKPSCTLT